MSALPYAWAKAQRILLRTGEEGAVLTVCPSTPGWSISEVRRQFGPARLERVRDEELDGLLASAYADTGSAAAVVGAAENEVDLDRLIRHRRRDGPGGGRDRLIRQPSAEGGPAGFEAGDG